MQNEKTVSFHFAAIRLKAYMTEMRGAIYMEGPLLIESIWKAV